MKNNTKGIGLKNFRRFENFPVLEFGNITYMVGRNNSGKSTMVKAMLLVLDYLQHQLSSSFSFESNILEDVNIVTYGRARNNSNNNPVINFEFLINEFNFQIEISGSDESTSANVGVFRIKDTISDITIEVNYQKGEVKVTRNQLVNTLESPKESPIVSQLEKALQKLKSDLDIQKNNKTKKFFALQSDYQKLLEKLKEARKIKNEIIETTSNNYEVSYTLSAIFGEENKNDDNPLAFIIQRLIFLNSINSKKSKKEISNLADVTTLGRNSSHLSNCVDRIISAIEGEQYFYIGANPSKQSALFYLRDKKNALSQAIHRFYQLGITETNSENEELRFVQEWMRKFDVGYDLDITFVAGEAYDVKIYESEEKKEKEISSYLADKGMGSLQVMTIILRIASLIREKKKINNKAKIFTLLIEEPELNLHPDLQSKLTDFFHEINKEYGFNFIVETHSEYMIRKAQLIAIKQDYIKNQDINPNPFKVFYFHKVQGPYELKIISDGMFDRDFGNGFFNVIDDIALDIFLLNNSKE